jgi:C-terminal processing protease CtpA/Prc
VDETSRFKGKVFVLIGHRTVSDCTTFAQVIRFYKAGKLIGEETADPTVRGAEYISFKLPNSDLNFCVTTKKFILVGGKPDGRGVIPDYEVKQKPEDTAKGVDTVLQFTLDLIRKSSS